MGSRPTPRDVWRNRRATAPPDAARSVPYVRNARRVIAATSRSGTHPRASGELPPLLEVVCRRGETPTQIRSYTIVFVAAPGADCFAASASRVGALAPRHPDRQRAPRHAP